MLYARFMIYVLVSLLRHILKLSVKHLILLLQRGISVNMYAFLEGWLVQKPLYTISETQ